MDKPTHLTLDDCLKLYDSEGIMGLVERVKEISFKAGIKEVVGWCTEREHVASNLTWTQDWQDQCKKWLG